MERQGSGTFFLTCILSCMPDAFFASSKPRKRKRSDAGPAGPSTKKFARKDGLGNKKAPSGTLKRNARKPVDEELDSDQTNDEGGDLDDLDLTADVDVDPGASGDEDDETPAEKRLRLAKLYLESVKEGLGRSVTECRLVDL